jgi:hypothetical protein
MKQVPATPVLPNCGLCRRPPWLLNFKSFEGICDVSKKAYLIHQSMLKIILEVLNEKYIEKNAR